MNYLVVLFAIVGSLSYLSAGDANSDEISRLPAAGNACGPLFVTPPIEAGRIVRLPTQSDAAANASEPLFLTPLIEANKIEEAKKLASVKPFLGSVRSYSGLLTVNKTRNSNMFIWFFPAERNAETAPVAVWLAGMLTSSFPGVLAEIGPYRIIDNRTIGLSSTSWTQNVSVLFIDNPIGSGFSFTNSSQGYSHNEVDVGRNLYAALVQFYALFPEVSKNELYLVGASYGGKHAPALAYEIHQRQLGVEPPIMNLAGVMLIAGYSDPMRQFKSGEYLYQLGMIDARGRDEFQRREKLAMKHLQENNHEALARELAALIFGDDSGPSLFAKWTGLGYTGVLDIMRSRDSIANVVKQFVTSAFVRDAVHVGNLTYGAFGAYHDAVVSVVPQIEALIDKIKFLFVGGNNDPIVPFAVWDDILAKLKWSGAPEYRHKTREIWKVNGDVVGYVKSVNDSRMMFAWVRDAGHIVSRDQPWRVNELMQKLMLDKPLDLSYVNDP